MGSEQIAAILYVGLISIVALFQSCLVFGASWGRITQGGRYEGALPIGGRAVAGVSIVVLIFMGMSVTSEAGLAPNWASCTA